MYLFEKQNEEEYAEEKKQNDKKGQCSSGKK